MYRYDQLKVTVLTSKLKATFLAGLRCSQPTIRAKFFEIFDGSMRRRLHDRLLYIVCSHTWDTIGQHYWIKQCIELLIITCNTNSNESHLLPGFLRSFRMLNLMKRRILSYLFHYKIRIYRIRIRCINCHRCTIDSRRRWWKCK